MPKRAVATAAADAATDHELLQQVLLARRQGRTIRLGLLLRRIFAVLAVAPPASLRTTTSALLVLVLHAPEGGGGCRAGLQRSGHVVADAVLDVLRRQVQRDAELEKQTLGGQDQLRSGGKRNRG